MSDDLKRSGGFIPLDQVETSDYLDKVMSFFPGSLFLALIAVFPAIVVSLMDVQQSWAMFWRYFIIIMVGVAIDTMQQINSYFE
jgi:preprotein translocase subunit SecY